MELKTISYALIDESIVNISLTQFDVKALDTMIQQGKSKGLFESNSGVILNIQTQEIAVDECAILIEHLAQSGLIVLGLKTTHPELMTFANIAKITLFNQSNSQLKSQLAPNLIHTRLPMIVSAKMANQAQIYAKDRDLVVLNPIRADYEVLSDKNIAVYNKVSGKIFAGISGDKDATIFIQVFQASLISIAGVYRIFDEIPSNLDKKSVLIYLKEGVLVFSLDKKYEQTDE